MNLNIKRNKLRITVIITSLIVLMLANSASYLFAPFNNDLANKLDQRPNIKTSGTAWIVDADGTADFTTIQDAINIASPGDSIIVKAGIYIENIIIHKSLNIESTKGAENTIIHAFNPSEHLVQITANFVELKGFTIRNTSANHISGLLLNNVEYCEISRNIIANHCRGIDLKYSHNNVIKDNYALDNWNKNVFSPGIGLYRSHRNFLKNNSCLRNKYGILFGWSYYNIISKNILNSNRLGIWLDSSSHNEITNNDINYNIGCGIDLCYGSRYNTVANNSVKHNGAGIYLIGNSWVGYPSNNKIYLNDFIDNPDSVIDYSRTTNIWNSPELITYTFNGITYTNYTGNFWSDYAESDINHDGIGDIPYSIPYNQYGDKDNYPLIEPFENYFKPEQVSKIEIDHPKIEDRIKGDISCKINGTITEDITKVRIIIERDQVNYLNQLDIIPSGGKFESLWSTLNLPRGQYTIITYGLDNDGKIIASDEINVYIFRMIWPFNGIITQQFHSAHNGIDISSGFDNEGIVIHGSIYAVENGIVEAVLSDEMYGNRIRIDHGLVIIENSKKIRVKSFYVHLDEVDIAEDQIISQSEIIGIEGNTGMTATSHLSCPHCGWRIPSKTTKFCQQCDNSFGVHLHFEVRENDVAVNPISYFSHRMVTTSSCPVDLLVEDPDGLFISRDFNEIADAYYIEADVNEDGFLDDSVIITEEKVGDYLITVLPQLNAQPSDSYSLKIFHEDNIIILAQDVQIKNIPEKPYIIECTEDKLEPIIPVTIDFDPDTLNLESSGKWITVYIELPIGHGYDISEIDISSILLNDQINANLKPNELGDYDLDGIPDLMVKFDLLDIQEMLQVGENVPIIITGKLEDERTFRGEDTIRVISYEKIISENEESYSPPISYPSLIPANTLTLQLVFFIGIVIILVLIPKKRIILNSK